MAGGESVLDFTKKCKLYQLTRTEIVMWQCNWFKDSTNNIWVGGGGRALGVSISRIPLTLFLKYPTSPLLCGLVSLNFFFKYPVFL